MASTVFGVEIKLQDYASPVAADANIGLYSITSDLSGDAAAAQKEVAVDDGSIYTAGEKVKISDDSNSEINVVASIAGNTLTMYNDLANAYTTAANAKVDAGSVFRWIQNDISGLSGWKSGMIVPGGIDPWDKSINLGRGGNIEQGGKAGVAVRNTSKFWDTVKDKGIYFSGLPFRTYEFSDTTPAQRWIGVCEDPEWDTKRYDISAIGSLNKRRSFLGTIITGGADGLYPEVSGDILGQMVPLTCGKHQADIDADGNVNYYNYAKMMRVANEKNEWLNIDSLTGISSVTPSDLALFKVSSGSAVSYVIKIADSFTLDNLSNLSDDLTGKYIHIIEGASDGAYRKITQVTAADGANGTITVSIDSYFETTLTSSTWLSISSISREYQSDVWPLKGFIDDEGNLLTPPPNAFQLFKWDSDTSRYDRFPDEGMEIESGDTDYNKLIPRFILREDDPDTMNSFLVRPAENLKLVEAASTLHAFGIAGDYYKVADGLFRRNQITNISNYATTSIANATDKDSTTYANLTFRRASQRHVNPNQLIATYSFKLPPYPTDFTFDTIYIGIKFNHSYSHVSGDSKTWTQGGILYTRRFTGSAVVPVNKNDFAGASWDMESLPDFYYSDEPANNNKNFYLDADTTALLAGYKNYEITGIDCREKYEAIQELLFIANMQVNFEVGEAETIDVDLKLYEIAIMFKKSMSMEDEIYTEQQGREFNDTWGARKTAADLMASPLDFLEHVCRLQNWEEVNPMPSAGWGREYSEGPLICLSGDGSFDDADLTAVLGAFKGSRQVLKDTEMYSDKLKKSICRNFFLANYTNSAGEECVTRILKSETSPATALTIADIYDRKRIRVIDPSPSDIFAEPFVRYNKNNATGGYQGAIRIKNADAEVYDPSYVEGLDGTEAETYWTRCHNLWLKIRQFNNPPSELTDLEWANGEDGYEIAKDYLENWIDWMYNPRIILPVHYNVAKDWDLCKRFTIQLAHHTDNLVIECIVTKLRTNPYPPNEITIEAIMFSETIPDQYSLQDTMTALTGDSDWADNMETFAERGSGLDDREDSM